MITKLWLKFTDGTYLGVVWPTPVGHTIITQRLSDDGITGRTCHFACKGEQVQGQYVYEEELESFDTDTSDTKG